jgi:hypothetical protein
MQLLGERGVAVHTKASPDAVELAAQNDPLCRAPILGSAPAAMG